MEMAYAFLFAITFSCHPFHLCVHHCGYFWTYTGGANRTVCPNCEQHVNVIKDAVVQKVDPFDPMNTPYRPGMTKEEIFDLMAEKLIRNGEKITPEMKELMEMLAEKAANLGKEKYGKEDGERKDGKDDKKK